MARPRRLLFAAIALGAIATATSLGAKPPVPKPPASAAPAKPPKGARDAGAPVAEPVSPAVPATSAAPAEPRGDAGVVEVKTVDGGTRVIKFTEQLEIEGRLRSPQLVYFLRRVRAEFSAGELGHRPFLRELSETRKAPSF